MRDERLRKLAGLSTRGDGLDWSTLRLLGAIQAVDSCWHVLEEARRALVEARFLLLSEGGSTLEQREQAVLVLERGIHDAEYALNLTEEPGE